MRAEQLHLHLRRGLATVFKFHKGFKFLFEFHILQRNHVIH